MADDSSRATPSAAENQIKKLNTTKKLAFCCTTLVLFFVSFELLLRLTDKNDPPIPAAANTDPTPQAVREVPWDLVTIPDPILHHKWRPNIHATRSLAPNFTYSLRTNTQSWVEDYDIELAKPETVTRIFYVGDSNTEGLAPPGARMVDLVEAGLNKVADGPVEVINTGTTSYSPLIYYLLIREKILAYQPDLIVVNVDMTDVANDHLYRQYGLYDENGKLLQITGVMTDEAIPIGFKMTPHGLARLTWYEYLADWLTTHTAICRKLAAWLPTRPRVRYLVVEPNQDAAWLALAWNPSIEANVRKTLDVLANINSLLKRHNIPWVLTGVPHYPQYTGIWSARPHAALATFARENGVPFLNAYDELAAEIRDTEQSAFYLADDPTHFNIAGQKVWSKCQLKFLQDHKDELRLLQRSPRRGSPGSLF